MKSRSSSVQKSLIKQKETSPSPVDQASPRDLKKRVSWGNQKVRTYLKDNRHNPDHEHYSLLEPGEAEHPISPPVSTEPEPMSIDMDASVYETIEDTGVSNPNKPYFLRDLYEGDSWDSRVERMTIDDTPMDDKSLMHDRGVAGRYVKRLEESPIPPMEDLSLTPVREEPESMTQGSTSGNRGLKQTQIQFTPKTSQPPVFDLSRAPLQENAPQFQQSMIPKPLTTKTESGRESASSLAQRPETPRKYISSRASVRRNSANQDAIDTTNPPSVYAEELCSQVKFIVPIIELPELKARKPASTDISKFIREAKEYEESLRAEIDEHTAFTAAVAADNYNLQEDIRRLEEEVRALEEESRAADEQQRKLDWAMSQPSFKYVLREIDILKEFKAWELTATVGTVKHYRHTYRPANRDVYQRFRLKVKSDSINSATLDYSEVRDFTNSILDQIFPMVNAAFSRRVQGLTETEILSEAAFTVERMLDFINSIDKFRTTFSNIEHDIRQNTIVTSMLFADSIPVSFETDGCLKSFRNGREVSLEDTITLIKA
mmetsp:Transcript_19999/g.37130  ORF Transcript_19999/g.37130 Transcript_19999/m.37130 type:complete len:546 (-) Transcript_19999:5953-7590(-)